MNQQSKPGVADADAVLQAMGRVLREQSVPEPTTEDAPAASVKVDVADEALIERITQRVIVQQKTCAAPVQRSRFAPRSRWTGLVATAAGLALAWILLPTHFTPAPLPSYTLELSGIDGVVRSTSDDAAMLAPGWITIGNRLTLTLRPLRATEGAVAARLWRIREGRVEALDVAIEQSAAGAVRLDAMVGSELALAPGSHRLWLMVTREQMVPRSQELLAISDVVVERDRYVLPLTLRVRAPR